MSTNGQEKIYQMITDRILDLLAKGVVPWRKPWRGKAGLPRNLVSGKAYRGINVFLLSCWGGSPWWLTLKQANELGGRVRKGAKGLPVIFWKMHEVDERDEEGQAKFVPVLRYYTVFNLEQCEGIEAPLEDEEPHVFEPIEEAARIVTGMPDPPIVVHGGNRAYYRVADDVVAMPQPKSFEIPQEYYSTIYHELTHAVGSPKRLARKSLMESDGFGGHEYSKEELVAEFGAAFLCGQAGIEAATIANSTAYIGSWLVVLRNNPKWVIQAAGQAQKAADFILGIQSGQSQAAA